MTETGKYVKTNKTSGFGTEGVSPDRPKAAGWRSGGRNKTDLPHRERLFVCVSEVWSGVVVGSGVIEARLDDPIGRWDGAGSDADALLPEAEVAQDAFDHGWDKKGTGLWPLLDDAAADHAVAIVEHGGLTRRDRHLWPSN